LDLDLVYEAFRYTAAGGMERLWDVLVKAGIRPAESGWSVLSQARSVSLDGNTIVGFGMRIRDDTFEFEAFVAVIPEPTSIGLIVIAGTALLARRRRSMSN